MSEDTKPAPKKTTAEAPERMARVRVLKHRTQIKNFIHGVGSIAVMPAAEFELRQKSGEVELLNLI